VTRNLPTRVLREHPDLDQLRTQAKELRQAFMAGDQSAVKEVNSHYRDADPSNFALHDAQLVLARAYGFESWPRLKAHVDGIVLKRLVEAVQTDDLAAARALLKARPELAHMSMDNLQVIHHAVLNRSSEMVRLLMEHGAEARHGVYPHRDATTAISIAQDREYHEIVAIIEEAEQGRRDQTSGLTQAPAPNELSRAIAAGDNTRAIGMLKDNPVLVHTWSVEGLTPLHVAARSLNVPLLTSLLEHGANPSVRGPYGLTPLDAAAYFSRAENSEVLQRVASLLLERGAALTAPVAVALGNVDWLQARHAEGALVNTVLDISGGLLRIAASHNRPEILSLLLDFGFDPDERTRMVMGDEDNQVFTWGMPLSHCAGSGKYAMAEMLLKRGADPNASIYASGDPVFWAFGRRDWKMVQLLESYGGIPTAYTAALYRQTDLARKMLAGETPYRLGSQGTLAEDLLKGAACGGDPEIVRLALERVDWPRDDARWFEILEQPLRLWNHGSGPLCDEKLNRDTYVECFRVILQHCDPNIRGREYFNLTLLHAVAGSREHLTGEERIAFATVLLDAGARTDFRDNLLRSTPLGWACRWGRVELVELFLKRGADAVEADAESWAKPQAWAEKMKHERVLSLLGKN
jgi:ankyrin repeat protein